MARATQNKLYRTFVKGLITEAGPLTYPENASVNESNCVIYRSGNRSRRLGIDYEINNQLSPFSVAAPLIPNQAIHCFEWQAVDKQADLYYLVVQIGLTLYFYDMTFQPITSGLKHFTLDLTPFIVSGYTPTQAAACETDMAGGSGGFGQGALFVVGSLFEPFYVTYDVASDTISSKQITIQIRDFVGVDDMLANDEEPTTLTPSHQYNLMNQGWLDATQQGGGSPVTKYGVMDGPIITGGLSISPITTYHTVVSRYPSNAKQWFLGQVAVAGPDGLPGNLTYAIGQFDPELLNTFVTGNGLAPRGHYIFNAFNQDRSSVSGLSIPAQPNQVTNHRPVSVTFFSGRVWYCCDGTVYYSQVLADLRWAGFCFQSADPTSQTLSDLVATDGGYVPIPEMASAVKLHPFGSGVMVFATNGVWFISGGGQASAPGFFGTDMAVTKLSGVGTKSPNSVVEDSHYNVYFWGTNGIWKFAHKIGAFGALAPIAIGGAFDKELISEMTIQSFYNNIPDQNKKNAHGVYDWATNTIQWLYNTGNSNSSSEGTFFGATPHIASFNPYFFDGILNMDLTLGSFYPWTISSFEASSDYGATPWMVGIYNTQTLNQNRPDGTPYVPEVRATYIQYLTAVPSGDQPSQWTFTVSYFNNTAFGDWIQYATTNVQFIPPLNPLPGQPGFVKFGYPYLSFVDTGYELLEDAERQKEIGYVFCYFKQTEIGWIENGKGTGDYDLVHPSSCLFQTRWDWSSNSASNRWSTKQQAYKPRRFAPPDITNLGYVGFDR